MKPRFLPRSVPRYRRSLPAPAVFHRASSPIATPRTLPPHGRPAANSLQLIRAGIGIADNQSRQSRIVEPARPDIALEGVHVRRCPSRWRYSQVDERARRSTALRRDGAEIRGGSTSSHRYGWQRAPDAPMPAAAVGLSHPVGGPRRHRSSSRRSADDLAASGAASALRPAPRARVMRAFARAARSQVHASRCSIGTALRRNALA